MFNETLYLLDVVKDIKEGECLKYIRAVGHSGVKDVKIS